jgi:hypothetical protein
MSLDSPDRKAIGGARDNSRIVGYSEVEFRVISALTENGLVTQ